MLTTVKEPGFLNQRGLGCALEPHVVNSKTCHRTPEGLIVGIHDVCVPSISRMSSSNGRQYLGGETALGGMVSWFTISPAE